MDFHKQYRGMNENITPSDALVQQTIAKMESGRAPRERKPLKIILAVAAALACASTAVAANQEAVLRVLYQIAPGMAEYLQPVGQVCEDQGVKLEVVSADVEGSTAKVYLSLTDTTGSLFGDAAPDLYDSWHLDYPRWGRAAPLSCGCSTVDCDPSTHTATYLHQINDLGGDIPAGAFEFSFNKLLICKVEQAGIPVTADLSAVPKNAPTENHEINGLSTSDISLYETMHDYDFLVQQGTLWQSEDGNFTLTAAAWHDGALHLSYRTEGKLSRDNHADFAVLRMTDGTELWRDYDVSYVDSDADAEVTEYVFPMAYEDVAGCTLTGDLYTASNLMDGIWAVSFRLTQ